MKKTRSALILLLVCALPAVAAEKQSHAAIHDTALAYAQAQTRALPGKVSIKVQDIDPRTALPACTPLEAFLPAGSQLLGRTTIGVRCNAKPGWTVFLQASIKVSASILVSNRPLSQGTVLTANDFGTQEGELGQPGLLTDPAQAIGKTLKFSIGGGQMLRQDMLRAPFVVRQGKPADVKVRGDGFTVSASGQALNDGAEGQFVQVRMPSGQVVGGTATADGSVEVRP